MMRKHKLQLVAVSVVWTTLVGLAQPQGPDTIWMRIIEFPELSFLNIGEVAALPSGNVLVSLAPIDTPYVYTGMALCKIDTSGTVLWRRGCGDPTYWFDRTFLCEIAPNRFAMAGVTAIIPQDFYDVYIAIADSEATTIDQHLFQWPQDERVAGISPSGDGGFLAVYKTRNLYTGHETIAWMKIDAVGDSLWANSLEIPGNRIWARSVASTSDGGYVISGYTGLPAAPTSALVIMLDNAGNIQLYRTYSPMSNTAAWDVAVLTNGDIVMCGYSASDAFVMRFNSAGDSLWTWLEPPDWGGGQGTLIVPSRDGGFVVNYTQGSDLVRFNTDNEVVWRQSYFDLQPAWHFGLHSLYQDTQERYLMIGDAATDTSTIPAMGVIKTLPDLIESAGQSRPIFPQDFRLAVHPNPFNLSTTITYDLPRAAAVKVVIFNMLGQEVATVVTGLSQAGHQSVPFDASGLASGGYFCRLQAGQYQQIREMILLK